MKAFNQRLLTACLLAAAVTGASYAGGTQTAVRQQVDAVTCATPPATPAKKESSTKTKKTTKKKAGKKQKKKKTETRRDTASVQRSCCQG